MTDQKTAILAALALLAAGGSAAFAGVSTPKPSLGAHGEPRAQAPRPAATPDTPGDGRRPARRGAGVAQRTISTDAREPRVRAAIARAVATFNDAGAGVYLKFTRSGGDIRLTMTDEFRGQKAGETTLLCELPCRPKNARIVIERVLDDGALAQIVVHEVGHSVGLDHDNRGCAAMNGHVRHDEPCRSKLSRAPLQERDITALRAIWGLVATT